MNKTNDMLHAVVKRGVSAGWEPKERPQTYINNNDTRPIYFGQTGKSGYTPADLIADKGFMGSVYREECHLYDKKCIDGYCSAYPDNENCPDHSYFYHGIEAYKLLLTKGADVAIEYLYENMPEEGKDELS